MIRKTAPLYMGGGIGTELDLQRFAEVSNPYTDELEEKMLISSFIDKALIDLSYYARDNIANYEKVTEISQENIEYLSSGLSASNCELMFSFCRRLKSIPWNDFNIDTNQCTSMEQMFYQCNALTSLDLSNFDTSQVTNMNYMFGSCYVLTSLDLSSFDTSKVTDMAGMFNSCYDLISLDLSNFNTSQVTDMYGMFYDCNALTSLDLSNFDTSKVTDMNDMFYSCVALTSLDLSNFDTSKVTRMDAMFNNCMALTSLDLSNFDTSQVTDMYGMFNGCKSLQEIICPNGFDLSSCTSIDRMFYDCNSYIGEPLHFKNVPRDLDFSTIGGTEGVHYVIDSYKD